tara:strand:- start:400 stop:963 length:564 start_codon:yes stop_codon:yes gene_type:complete
MKSPFYFIAQPINGKRYNNTKEIGGLDFITSSSEEDHSYSNREAEVISTPLGYNGPISKGDKLLVHHNVFKFYNDMQGRQKSGRSFLKDNLFMIDSEQFFMYKNGSEWKAYDRYCFVEPIDPEGSYLYKNISKEPLVGIMRYPNEYLLSEGINEGDKVSFTPESEYKFDIEGVEMYRIYDHQITMKL